MPKESSHLPDKPLRILYVADYRSDKLIKTRLSVKMFTNCPQGKNYQVIPHDFTIA
jgi:hypothetical protein